MEKTLRYLPLVLLSAFTVKLLIHGANINEALISLGLMGLTAFLTHMPSQKQIAELNQGITELKEELASHKVEIDSTKTSVTGIKLASGFRPNQAKPA